MNQIEFGSTEQDLLSLKGVLSSLDVQKEIKSIQDSITSEDISLFADFGRKISQYQDLYERYWHLTQDYSEIKSYRNCDFYHLHSDKNNILNSHLSDNVRLHFINLHNKILSTVNKNAFSVYPAYVSSIRTSRRSRLPIHTHNAHKFVDREDDSLVSLSFAIKMTHKHPTDDSTRFRFYHPHKRNLMRLEEELHTSYDNYAYEFKPSDLSVYLFNTENSPHTAICGDELYCWLVFDYVKFNFPFHYENYLQNKNVLKLDLI